MVQLQLPRLGELQREAVAAAAADDEEESPLWKRFRLETQQLGPGASVAHPELSQVDLLDKPSPLGLRLKKSPSLVDLIEATLAQASKTKDAQSTVNLSASEKLKASNFPASLLRIGTWERVSRYGGDLVAKCYFAKHKLVWEVLNGGLKSKIEIQWSDISALKVTCPEGEPGTLEIVLSRQPLFFKETNPQPRKHTLWQSSSDFTGGQAIMHRRHFLQCQPGMMNKHIEKLICCDTRLYSLSQQPSVTLDNPYFEPSCSILEEREDSKYQGFGGNNDDCQLGPQRFQELLVPQSMLGRTDTEARKHDESLDAMPYHLLSSATDTCMIKQVTPIDQELQSSIFNWNTLEVPGIQRPMSDSEFMNHIGHHIYGQINLVKQPNNGGDSSGQRVFEELAGYLLNDTQVMDTTDENMVMSRVKSLCCLLEKDSSTDQGLQTNHVRSAPDVGSMHALDVPPLEEGGDNHSFLPSQESMGQVQMHLPCIPSFPHFL